MHALRFDQGFLITLLGGVIVTDVGFTVFGVLVGFHSMKGEAGVLEVVQLALLATATAAFGGLSFRGRHATRIAAVGATAICTLFFVRELETPNHDPVLRLLSRDPFLYLLVGVFSVILFVVIYRNWVHFPVLIKWLVRLQWWPFLVAGALLVVGSIFEKSDIEFMEELLELDAHATLALTGGIALWRVLPV